MKLVGRVGVRRLVSLVAATSLGTGAAAVLAAPAFAGQPVSAIDTVTVSQTRVAVDSTLRVDATWSLADGEAKAGDTFTLTMPTDPRLISTAMTFKLLDQNSTQVGTCVTTATDVTCTFNDYVETHSDVRGTLFVWTTVKSEASHSTATFTADGKAIVVPIPPIGPVGNQVWPTRPLKTGTIDHDAASWSVLMPGATLLAEPGDITITDTYDSRLGDLVAAPKIYWVTESQWTATSPSPWSYNQYLSNPSEFTFTLDPANHSVTVTIDRAAIHADRLYLLQYRNTLPADVVDGEIFTNHAAGTNWQTDSEITMHGAGGDARGDRRAVPPVPPAPPTPTPVTPTQKMDTPTTPAVSSPSATATAGASKNSALASTGASVLGAAGIAFLLLAGGATVLVIRRRKAA